MYNQWRPKPADRIFRPRRIRRYRLRRVLGVSAVFSAGYGNVGSSIYYALGIVALVSMGATPVALGAAGFTAGWALMLSYKESSSSIQQQSSIGCENQTLLKSEGTSRIQQLK